jgi:hypothetical protein
LPLEGDVVLLRGFICVLLLGVPLSACGSVEPTPPEPSDLALHEACARYVSCLKVPGRNQIFPNISWCGWDQQTAADFLSLGSVPPFFKVSITCINRSGGNCEAVAGCIADSDRSCNPQSDKGRYCAGTSIEFCDADGRINRRDCMRGAEVGVDPGATCMLTGDQRAICGFGSCVGKPVTSCDANVALTCDQGVLQRQTCIAPLVCIEGATGGQCAGSGSSCPVSAPARCDRDEVVTCAGGCTGSA